MSCCLNDMGFQTTTSFDFNAGSLNLREQLHSRIKSVVNLAAASSAIEDEDEAEADGGGGGGGGFGEPPHQQRQQQEWQSRSGGGSFDYRPQDF